jgi:hypothetical protein
MTERPDEIVLIGHAPNVPLAELAVNELRGNGIEAFYKVGWVSPWGGTSVTSPASPCGIYVQRADAERASKLLPPDR